MVVFDSRFYYCHFFFLLLFRSEGKTKICTETPGKEMNNVDQNSINSDNYLMRCVGFYIFPPLDQDQTSTISRP